MKVLFVFVDGFGIGSDDPERNPLLDSRYPTLGKLISEATPVDACLGVAGKPQSATGQATLLTGVNAAQAMGRHMEGFPLARLKELIQQENIFSKLQNLGKELYRSDLLKETATETIDIDVSNVDRLELITESGKTGNAYCWSVWGSPTLFR
ncbi:MAG: NPCBM/NEW2 domain-containing protein [Pontiella sp.]